MQQYHTLEPTRGEIAEALHEWRTALAAATESVEAELYACASVLVLDSLARYTTLRELINAYFFPDPDLKILMLDLCAGGDIRLQPRLLMGASCALRLRQLVLDAGQ